VTSGTNIRPQLTREASLREPPKPNKLSEFLKDINSNSSPLPSGLSAASTDNSNSSKKGGRDAWKRIEQIVRSDKKEQANSRPSFEESILKTEQLMIQENKQSFATLLPFEQSQVILPKRKKIMLDS
jgi:hypothetical protein